MSYRGYKDVEARKAYLRRKNREYRKQRKAKVEETRQLLLMTFDAAKKLGLEDQWISETVKARKNWVNKVADNTSAFQFIDGIMDVLISMIESDGFTTKEKQVMVDAKKNIKKWILESEFRVFLETLKLFKLKEKEVEIVEQQRRV